MRILHIISSLGFYGAERVAVELAKGLNRRGGTARMALIAPHPENSEATARAARADGVECLEFHCSERLSFPLIRELRDLIRGGRFDIVHTHGYKSNFYALASAPKKLPLVATNHNWLKHHWRLTVYSLLDKGMIRFFDRIVAVSEPIRDEMVRAGIPPRKIRVIDNGVDVDVIASQATRSAPAEGAVGGAFRKTVGAVGSLKEEKGFGYLIEAARRVVSTIPDARFVIVGEGPLRGELERRIAESGLDGRVTLAGYRTDVYSLLATFDLFVLPSVREGLPMVLLEGMAAGKPVVASRVGAVPRVIEDGVNGLIVDPGDPEGLAAAMERILSDPGLARGLAERGRATVRASFSSEAMFSRYFAIYTELAGSAQA